MQRSGRFLILVGVIVGVVAAITIVATLNSNTTPPPPVKLVQVVVAQQAVPLGAHVVADAVTTANWPEEAVRPDTITNTKDVVDKIATTNIVPGQVFVSSMVVDKLTQETQPRPGSPASYVIPADKVAVAFPIDPVSDVAAAVQEGDHVDLIVSYQLATTNQVSTTTGVTQRQVTQITIQDVEILHVGLWAAAAEGGSTAGPYLTLLVTPQDALVLKFLRETGTAVQFVLRGAGNHQVVKTQPVVIEYVDQRFNFGGLLSGLR